MSQDVWTAVDHYVNELLVPAGRSLTAALRANADAGLPPHDVSRRVNATTIQTVGSRATMSSRSRS